MRLTTCIAALTILPHAFGTNFDVIVGFNGMRAYMPTEVHPNVGDTVTFRFVSGNRWYLFVKREGRKAHDHRH